MPCRSCGSPHRLIGFRHFDKIQTFCWKCLFEGKPEEQIKIANLVKYGPVDDEYPQSAEQSRKWHIQSYLIGGKDRDA